MKKVLAILLFFMISLTGCGKNDCKDGVMEGNRCKVKVEEKDAVMGLVCRDNYELTGEGECVLKEYADPIPTTGCEEGLKIDSNNLCSGTAIKDFTYTCSTGTLDGTRCVTKTLIGEATLGCDNYPDPKIYRDGKCYLGLPMLPEGCEAGDISEDGWCYNMKAPREPSYGCAKGQLEDGKCYDAKEVGKATKKCEDGYTVSNNKCTKKVTGAATITILTCDSGFTLEGDKCARITDKVGSMDGLVCNDPAFTLEGEKCIRYEYR